MGFKVTGVHHVGLTVRDIQRSIEWYTDAFDLAPGPINRGEGEELSRSVQVENTVLSFSMIDIGGTRIELLEYHNPKGKDFDRTNGDVGSSHVCIQVDDVDEAIRDLTEKGVVFNAPPVTLTDGAFAGSKWAYLRDPDGIQLEIWESPAE